MVEDDALVAGYREMAADLEREREAEEWCEGLIADGQAQFIDWNEAKKQIKEATE